MKVDTYQCDGCGKQKKAANHWFKGFKVRGGVIVMEWEQAAAGISTAASHFGAGFLANEQEAHLCGAACLNEWLSKNLLN